MNFKHELTFVQSFSNDSIIEVPDSYISEIFNFLEENIQNEFEETNDKQKIFELGQLKCIVDRYISKVQHYRKHYKKLQMNKLDIENLLQSCVFIENFKES